MDEVIEISSDDDETINRVKHARLCDEKFNNCFDNKFPLKNGIKNVRRRCRRSAKGLPDSNRPQHHVPHVQQSVKQLVFASEQHRKMSTYSDNDFLPDIDESSTLSYVKCEQNSLPTHPEEKTGGLCNLPSVVKNEPRESFQISKKLLLDNHSTSRTQQLCIKIESNEDDSLPELDDTVLYVKTEPSGSLTTLDQFVRSEKLANCIPLRRHIRRSTERQKLNDLRSRRYLRSLHCTCVKHHFDAEKIADNSRAKVVSVLNKDFETIIRNFLDSVNELTHFMQQVTIDCVFTPSLTQICLVKLTTCEPCRAMKIHAALKLLLMYNPPPRFTVDVDNLLKIFTDQFNEPLCSNELLITDYIVTSIELQLLHYPVSLARQDSVIHHLSVNSSFIKWLINRTVDNRCRIEILYLLQRALVSVSQVASRNRFNIGHVSTQLICIYNAQDDFVVRCRILSTTVLPQQRFSLSQQLLGARCTDKSCVNPNAEHLIQVIPHFLGHQFKESCVCQAVCDSEISDERIEEFVLLIVTVIESYLLMKRDGLHDREIGFSDADADFLLGLPQFVDMLQGALIKIKAQLSATTLTYLEQLRCLEDIILYM